MLRPCNWPKGMKGTPQMVDNLSTHTHVMTAREIEGEPHKLSRSDFQMERTPEGLLALRFTRELDNKLERSSVLLTNSAVKALHQLLKESHLKLEG